MLSPDTVLSALAQLGVSIPGFAAVFAVLRRRDKDFTAAERTSFLLMLTLASVVVIGSLVPFALADVLSPVNVWRVCSGVLGVVLGALAIGTGRHAVRTRGTDGAPRRPRLLWWTGIVPFLLTAAAQLTGMRYPSAGLYLGGLIVAVCGAGYLFWFSVLAHDGLDRVSPPDPPAAAEPEPARGD